MAAGTKKELLLLLRDRPAAFYAIFMPIVLLALFIYVSSVVFVVPIGLIDEDGSAHSKALVAAFESHPGIIISTRDSTKADELLRSRELNAVVKIPQGFGSSVDSRGTGKVLVTYDNTRDIETPISILEVRKPIFSFYANIAKEKQLEELGTATNPMLASVSRVFLTPLLREQLSAEQIFTLIGQVLEIDETPAYAFELPKLALPGRVPVMMVLVILLFSSIIAPFSIINEKKSGLLERLFTLPLRPYEIIVPKILVLLGIVAMQSAILVAMMQYYYRFDLFDPGQAWLVLTIFGYATAALSLFLATISKKALGAIELVVVALAFQMIFGSFVVNPGILPAAAKVIYYAFPAVHANAALGRIVLTHLAFPITPYLWYMLGFGVFFTALSFVAFKTTRMR